MDHAQDLNAVLLDGVDDDVFRYGEAAHAGAKLVLAAATDIGVTGEQEKAAGEGVDEAVGDFDAGAFGGDVESDGVEVFFGLRSYAEAHQADRASSVARGGGARALTPFSRPLRGSDLAT